jgi:hypothetical protein
MEKENKGKKATVVIDQPAGFLKALDAPTVTVTVPADWMLVAIVAAEREIAGMSGKNMNLAKTTSYYNQIALHAYLSKATEKVKQAAKEMATGTYLSMCANYAAVKGEDPENENFGPLS